MIKVHSAEHASLTCGVVQIVQKAADLQEAISEGATSFLLTEYKYMGIFMVRGYWEIQMIGRGQSRAGICLASVLLCLTACMQGVPLCTWRIRCDDSFVGVARSLCNF